MKVRIACALHALMTFHVTHDLLVFARVVVVRAVCPGPLGGAIGRESLRLYAAIHAA